MIFATELAFPEGPVVLEDGSLLVVEIAAEPAGRITHLSADGHSRRTVAETGRPNGLAVDCHGDIWVAESRQRALLRVSLSGRVEVVQRECDGEPFLFPNDLCFGPDGSLYLTDSGIAIDDFAPGNQVRPDYQTVVPDGRVYRVDTGSGAITCIDRAIRFTNGIAFDPQRRLHIAETLTGLILQYEDASLQAGVHRQSFGSVIAADGPDVMKGPDGMAFDRTGNLYVAVFGQGDITVLGSDGVAKNRYTTAGNAPTNVAFGPPGSGRIYVTESQLGQIEVFDVDAEGLPLWS